VLSKSASAESRLMSRMRATSISNLRIKWLWLAALTFLLGTASIQSASALPCSPYTYTFSNGTTADAGQVNSNFSNILTCANTLLAPLSAPSFTTSLGVAGTITDSTDGDTAALANFQATISPTADSGTNTAAILAVPIYNTSHNLYEVDTNAPTAAIFQNLIVNTGTIADISGAQFWGLWVGDDASTMGTVSSVQGGIFKPIESFDNSLTTTVTKAVGIHVEDSVKDNLHITGQAGIQIDALAAATNNTSLLIGQTTVPTGSFAIYDASTNNVYLNGSVGLGTSSPGQKLEVNGKVKIDSFGSATSSTVCQLSGVLSSCSSSRRYKEDIRPASFGLREVLQMQPVTFKWKGRDEHDFGLVAEDIAKINPLFASYKDGRVEGVKYAQLTAILANAVKELKFIDDKQAAQIAELKTQVNDLHHEVVRQAEMRSTKSLPATYTTAH
jgi:hypothetical protein